MTRVDRRAFLVGGIVLAAMPAVTGCGPDRPKAAASPAGGPQPAPDLGIAPSNSPGDNTASLVAALQRGNRHVIFPPGGYQLDNADSPIRIREFGGIVEFQPGAELVFTEAAAAGVQFDGGRGAVLRNVTARYRDRPTARGNGPTIGFRGTTDTHVDRATITQTAGIGMLFTECHAPRVDGVSISHTQADGLHIANSSGARVADLTTESTGDDGLAFTNYGSRPDLGGGHTAERVTVTDSGTRGITVIGESNVTITGFAVHGSYNSGLRVSYEPNLGSGESRHPRGVTIADGRLDRAGCAPRGTGVGQPEPFAIFHRDTGSMASCRIADVTVDTVRAGWRLHPDTPDGPRYERVTGPRGTCTE